MKQPPRITIRAAITADGKLASDEDPVRLRGHLADDRVDEIHLTVRPVIDGRGDAATLAGAPGGFFPASIRCRLVQMEVSGQECLLRYRVVRPRPPRKRRAGK